ncbi:MAG: sugar transferase [Hydrogenophilales bacterium 28-61-23]|nr:MAG: sugar transferase [Hydrogenophilales bacterium 28-61-23]
MSTVSDSIPSGAKPVLIAHVVYHFGTGGMENGMVNLINRLPTAEFRHVVISLTDHTEFRQRIHRDDIRFVDLDKRPGHDLSWMGRLYSLLRELRPEIVHTRNLNALEAQFVAAAARVPARVHGEHGRDVFDLEGKNWKYNLLRRAARPLVHQYITVSRDLAGWLSNTVGVSNRRLSQIYNGVDSDKFHPRGARRPEVGPAGFLSGATCVIGSVGRMAAVKDYPTLVRAFIHACQQGEPAAGLRLLLVGDGPSRQECQTLLDQSGFAGRAWLAGNRDDSAELMRAMDVFVLPSLGEGISNTILEAMSTGLPVVATAVGGNPELVSPGETGLLFKPGASETLARALLDYAADPVRIANEGRAARARIERDFSLEHMVEGYRAVYRAALERV